MSSLKNRTIFTRDNLEVMRGMADECIDLIYLDPPFNSNHNYAAPIGSQAAGAEFKDTWTLDEIDLAWHGEIAEAHPGLYKLLEATREIHGNSMMAYLIYMSVRVMEMKRILKLTGSIYLHCDPTASHYLKLLMDEVFGKENFRNEVVWCYDRWEASSNRFQKMHDIIFFYSKNETLTFNRLTEIDAKRQRTLDRGYTTNLLGDGTRQLIIYEGSEDKPNIQKLRQKDKFDRVIIRPKEQLGRPLKDHWNIDFIHPRSKERTGYPTQKPLELLERVIKASSNEGDMVLDPFCGCATTCVAAEKIGRQWIGIDISEKAAELVKDRISKRLGILLFKPIHRFDVPTDKDGKRSKNIKHILYGMQEGKCTGCLHHFPFQNFTVDHIVPKSKGGSDTDENLQLLCGYCNSVKGNRTQEYLISQVRRTA